MTTIYSRLCNILRKTASGRSSDHARRTIRRAFLDTIDRKGAAAYADGLRAALSHAEAIAWSYGRGPVGEIRALLAEIEEAQ